jgi:hypothetical protein
MEAKADVVRVDNLHGLYPFLQVSGTSALVAFEAEPHILGGEGVAVVEFHTLAQLEIIRQAIGALAPPGRK